jgi:hypothetical protein
VRGTSGRGVEVGCPGPIAAANLPIAEREPQAKTGVAVRQRVLRSPQVAGRVTRVTFALAALVTSVTTESAAQIIRVPENAGFPPRVWVSGSLAALASQNVVDGRTSSIWEFGNRTAAQYRVSLELPVGPSFTAGVVGTFARAPLRYIDRDPLADPIGSGASYADADISSLAALFRIGGGQGFHQVIEASAGIMQYDNFRRRDGSALPPGPDRDLMGTIGYGAGYGFGRSFQVSLVQDFGVSLHQKEALPEDAGRVTQQRTTRLTLRYGFGGRR